MSVFAPNTIAYSYIRMSTVKQLDGHSLDRQMNLSQEYVKRHGLILDEKLTLHDIGKSGYSGANVNEGALGKFLEAVATGRVARGSVLLVESLDRLSRQHPMDASTILVSILNSGIDIVTVQDETHFSSKGLREDWTKLIHILAIQARAHDESRRKSELALAAAEKRRQEGLSGEGKYSHIVPGWIAQIKRGKGKVDYELNQHASTIKLIFDLSLSGMGQMAIAKEINRRGLPSMQGKSTGWHQTVIGKILDSPAAYGVLIPRKRINGKYEQIADPIPGYYPAAIDEDTFHKSQRSRQRKATNGRKGNKFTNLFNGMGSCIHCGGNMTINYKAAKGGRASKPYLRCYNSLRGNGCETGKKAFWYDPLEAVVLDTIREFGISDYAGNKNLGPEIAALDEAIRKSQATLIEIEQKETNLVGQLAMLSAASAQVLHRALDQMQLEKAEAKRTLTDAEKQKSLLVGSQDDFSDADKAIQEARKLWPTLPDDELYRSRSEVNATLRYLYDMILFDSSTATAHLVFANGLFAYHFKDGKLDGTTDAIAVGQIRDGVRQLEHFMPSRQTASNETQKREVEERRSVIKNFILARNKRVAGSTNPRLNDPDVIAIKTKRRQAVLDAEAKKRQDH